MTSRGQAAAIAASALALAALAVGSLPRDHRVAAYATSLEGRARSQRHNAVLALRRLEGVTIGPGETFSFNGTVGTYSRDQGYRKAPVSFNGQLIDDWGGGVCQTSTTLYNAALLAGMTIIERHRHQFAPNYVPPGRDAAVAYSNIDLRFSNPHPFPLRIATRQTPGELRVEFVAPRRLSERPTVVERVERTRDPAEIRFGQGAHTRLRASGKPGYEVTVYRITGDRREHVSSDSYPAMSRVFESR